MTNSDMWGNCVLCEDHMRRLQDGEARLTYDEQQ